MRGVATVIGVTFTAMLLFGIFAPALLEGVGGFVMGYAPIIEAELGMDMAAYTDNMYSVVFMWVPLITLGAAVVSAVVWYTRRESVARRRP